MVNVPDTAQKVSNDYAALGTYIGLATGNPGNTSTPANEASGGGYARQPTSWTAGTGGVNTGSQVTFNAPTGTYTNMIFCSGSGGNNMIDNCPITPSVTLSSPGQIQLTPVYTQS
jgi:hypothetical protein